MLGVGECQHPAGWLSLAHHAFASMSSASSSEIRRLAKRELSRGDDGGARACGSALGENAAREKGLVVGVGEVARQAG